MDVGEYLYELKEQEVMLVIAPLGPVGELPLLCGLCGTPYDDDECPTCRAGREDAKRLIQDRLRLDREEQHSLIRDVEERLEGWSMSERERLEREIEQLEAETRAAMAEEEAAAREAEKFARPKPLEPMEDPEPLDEDAMGAAFKRRGKTNARARKLRARLLALRQELDRCKSSK